MTKKPEQTMPAIKQDNALAMPANLAGSWGSEGVDNSDLKVPKLLLLQGLSDAVATGKAQQGEIMRSTNEQVLAKKGSSIEIIPLMTFKTWRLMEKKGQKYEYRGTQSFTPENKDAPLAWQESGVDWRRDLCLNFHVLLPGDIERELIALKKIKMGEMADPDDALLPCVITFTRSSYNAGKDLATHFKKAEHFGMPAAVTTFKLSSDVVKNDLGTFHVFAVTKSRQTTMEELNVCKTWYDTLQRVRVIVDEKVEEENASPAIDVSAEKQF